MKVKTTKWRNQGVCMFCWVSSNIGWLYPNRRGDYLHWLIIPQQEGRLLTLVDYTPTGGEITYIGWLYPNRSGDYLHWLIIPQQEGRLLTLVDYTPTGGEITYIGWLYPNRRGDYLHWLIIPQQEGRLLTLVDYTPTGGEITYIGWLYPNRRGDYYIGWLFPTRPSPGGDPCTSAGKHPLQAGAQADLWLGHRPGTPPVYSPPGMVQLSRRQSAIGCPWSSLQTLWGL